MGDHGGRRGYPSDLTDAQWALIEPLLPAPRGGREFGRPLTHPRREIVNAILWMARGGCSWRQLPGDLPPWGTVYDYFAQWSADATVDRIHDRLRNGVRDRAGRDPMASAGIVDAQSVKGADTVGAGSRGYDAGKKINGRKRRIVVDTLGLLIVVLLTAACVRDRDGGARVLGRARMAMPSLALVWADGGYAGKLVTWVERRLRIMLDIVRKPEGQRGFSVLPRRWVLERTLSWITAHRRLARDYERTPEHSETWVKWAMIGIMTRRLEPGPGRRPWQETAAA
ncbi:MAG: IS5 family transposase [Pseudonocardia sp.]